MKRKIIKIDAAACNGCGLCASACHEGAIGMADGKATLLREDYCDGLGDCLPACPVNAITFEEREAPAFDPAAVRAAKERKQPETLPCGCPGSRSKAIARPSAAGKLPAQNDSEATGCAGQSELSQWPVQIKLVPVNAPYFDGARLLVAADCTAFSYGQFHARFIRDHITLIGCPKLDEGDYAEKLTEILRLNNIKSLHIVRMEVPCCGGLENAAKKALQDCGKMIPWQVSVISTDGTLIEE